MFGIIHSLEMGIAVHMQQSTKQTLQSSGIHTKRKMCQPCKKANEKQFEKTCKGI